MIPILPPTGLRARMVRMTLTLSALLNEIWCGPATLGSFPGTGQPRNMNRLLLRGRICLFAILILLPVALCQLLMSHGTGGSLPPRSVLTIPVDASK